MSEIRDSANATKPPWDMAPPTKSADADVLRERIDFAAERLMELEVGHLRAARSGGAWPTSLRLKVPKLAAVIDQSEPDVLTYMGFPAPHRVKLHSPRLLLPTPRR